MIELRKSRRFEISLPLKLLRNGARPLSAMAETRNIGSGGVLFATDAQVEIGEPLEYIISLSALGRYSNSVDLRCLGKVLRLEPPELVTGGGRPYLVAVTLERYEFLRSGTRY